MTDINREHEEKFSELYRQDISPLVCIGRDVSVGDNLHISMLFISPAGNIAAVIPTLPHWEYLSVMQEWDLDDLDEFAADYFFQEEGQAYRVIDAMARCGYLTYSDEGKLSENLRSSLEDGDIFFMTEGA